MMLRYIRLLTFLLTVLMLTTVASYAEFYEYKDADGVLHFTDNPADVPKDQRVSLKPHAEIKSNDAAIQNAENAFDDVLKAIEEAAQKAKIEDIELQREKLNAIEAELDAERNLLEKERKALQEKKKKAIGNAAVRSYNEHVKQLEEKIKAFNLKMQAYDKQVAALNAIIRQTDE